jgi:hypothetical protein
MKHFTLTLCLAACVLTGCAPFRYSEFTGHQVWPTGPGTMADNGYPVPVYRGWPEKPYKVIGSIQFADPGAGWDDGDTKRAARLAKKKKGDALVMRFGAEAGVGAIAGAAADPNVFSMRQVAALVIKWKSPTEVADERAAVERFASDFRAKHPGLVLPDPVLAMAVDWMADQGLRFDSADEAAKLDRALVEVLTPAGDAKGSKWLFKGVLRSNALTRSYTQVGYGVAVVTRDGQTITIVSPPGKVGVHLSGTVKEGRLEGQMGVSSGSTMYSGKADGVFSPEQISVSGQAQTSDGLLQATFEFLH